MGNTNHPGLNRWKWQDFLQKKVPSLVVQKNLCVPCGPLEIPTFHLGWHLTMQLLHILLGTLPGLWPNVCALAQGTSCSLPVLPSSQRKHWEQTWSFPITNAILWLCITFYLPEAPENVLKKKPYLGLYPVCKLCNCIWKQARIKFLGRFSFLIKPFSATRINIFYLSNIAYLANIDLLQRHEIYLCQCPRTKV